MSLTSTLPSVLLRTEGEGDLDEEDLLVLSAEGQPALPNKAGKIYTTVADAIERNLWEYHKTEEQGDLVGWLYGQLVCEECVHYFNHEVYIPLPHEDYIKKMESTKRWWERAVLQAFAAMLSHACHIPSIVYCPCQSPLAVIEDRAYMQPNQGTEMIISVLCEKLHFTLLTIDLDNRHCTVYDGLTHLANNWTTIWKEHVSYVMMRTKLTETRPKWKYQPNSNRRMYATVEQERWTLHHEPWIEQKNGFDCGPIVGMKLMEIFGRLPAGFDKDNVNFSIIRKQVASEFRKVQKEIESDLRVTVKKSRQKSPTKPSKPISTKLKKPPTYENLEPLNAEDVRNLHLGFAASRASYNRQEQQAATMKRMADQDKDKQGANVGSKIVFRTNEVHHDEEGIKGVVFEKGTSGGIRIVTSHGVIVKNGGDGVFFVPFDFYNVLDDGAVLSDELEEYRREILDDTFDEETVPKITMNKAYRKEHNVEAKTTTSCKCKSHRSNRCGGTCGCTKRGHPCTKECGCGGNCKNPYNDKAET